MINRQAQLEELTHINTEDFLTSLGLEKVRVGRRVLDAICHYPSELFAQQMIQYDHLVNEHGLMEGSRRILMNYIRSLDVIGQENIPISGPVMLLSNHPGMSDTLALFSAIPRPDVRIVAAERPFLRALPSIHEKLIYVPEDSGQRMGVVRSVVSHLRQGGAILTFPAGKIEPDPAVMPGALEALQGWSDSITIFTRLVPQTKIVVAIVSGVIWEATLRHPITRLRRQQKDRERLAAALQLLVLTLRPRLKPNYVRVAFSEPLSADDPLVRNNPAALIQAIADRARLLIQSCKDVKPYPEVAGEISGGSAANFSPSASKPGNI